ncbi:hypothetical protein C8J57DRAFT_1234755 [Mycena rebaudengoi]|nr:hypothetical protein C8J57DRAFT_1234755 [Mycena rebaudengoi]
MCGAVEREADAASIKFPRYADALESGEEDSDNDDGVSSRARPVLINSARSWRKVHLKWMLDARDVDDDEELEDLTATVGPSTAKWLPRPLSKLFGGPITRPLHVPARRNRFTREELLMELLAAEHSDEEPDDGEKEGSGDDYED